MEIAFFWVVFSLAVGLLAGKRGRGSGTWFLFSLLVSPLIGLIILLCTADLKNAESQRTHCKCPACAELVLREATKCKHCGSPLTPQPYQETTWDKLTKMR